MINKETKGGYKNPPKHAQFKKGQSGNPSGRPQGRKNSAPLSKTIHDFQKALIDIGYETIKVTKDGTVVEMSMLEAMYHQAYKKAISGNTAATKLILDYTNKSHIGLAESAKRVFEVTKRLRDKERNKIFSPSPRSGTLGMFLKDQHYSYSHKFAQREIYGEENVPYTNIDEPRHELEWVDFNKTMREQYITCGHMPWNEEIEHPSIYEL